MQREKARLADGRVQGGHDERVGAVRLGQHEHPLQRIVLHPVVLILRHRIEANELVYQLKGLSGLSTGSTSARCSMSYRTL